MALEPRTRLELLPPGAIQPDLVVNPIIYALAMTGAAPVALDKDLATPPASPASGDTYIIASGATGAWSGRVNQVAYWDGQASSWKFAAPATADRWRIFVSDERRYYLWNGTTWVPDPDRKGADLASAGTVDLGAATGNFVHITGTTTITSFGTAPAGTHRRVTFDGVLTLTHNATSLILPTAASITTQARDCAEFVSEGSGNWRCIGYERADGTSLGGAPGSVISVNGKSGAVELRSVSALSIASGVVNIDASLGDLFTLDLTANVTSITFSNLPGSGLGQTIGIRMKQDATGGRTVALPSSFKAISGSDTSVQAVANAYTILIATTFDNGTRWEYSMKAGAA